MVKVEDKCPATRLRSRISIVRAFEHCSIDTSVETTATRSMAGNAAGLFRYIQFVTNQMPI